MMRFVSMYHIKFPNEDGEDGDDDDDDGGGGGDGYDDDGDDDDGDDDDDIAMTTMEIRSLVRMNDWR